MPSILDTVCLQFLAHYSHKPAERWYKENGEEGELPADADECNEIEENQDRIFEEHVERRHDAVLHFLHITAHAGNDISLALLAEETERETVYLLVNLVADVSYDTCTDRYDGG